MISHVIWDITLFPWSKLCVNSNHKLLSVQSNTRMDGAICINKNIEPNITTASQIYDLGVALAWFF